MAGYDGPVSYPGQAIDESEYEGLDEELLEAVKEWNGEFDEAALESVMMPAIEVARQHDLPLYCGEFGAFPAAPLELRQRWYRDMMAIFDRHGIAWAHWNYKDDFPLVSGDLRPISELTDILLPREQPAKP
jgi:endoglucanase